ncbi:heavy metal-associated domain-containing protein [Telmatospirillum sp.]|uniref:heavy-metal-associated domain-containing protein n=1 Tax=Telmatospirillum sp. TaxID=2079197 RepID=UPI00283F8DC1|nr:heavy metal-associated domain-containing protein [Telmatospirillum sp.]MDR3441005.1 heavy metal-associated domain-containing protein [Telmatospirillum sp.]
MAKAYKVSGMTCGGCVRSVERAIKAVAPDSEIEVDLASGKVSVEGTVDEQVIAKAVEDAGFDFGGAIV